MPNDTVLCQKLETTVSRLRGWLDSGNRERITDFLKKRFEERYFDPIQSMPKDHKNGFFIMAVSCLTLESLECFRKGWPSSDGKSKGVFRDFLTREPRFDTFKLHADLFYIHVRCGILHQAETNGGWKIRRDGALFEPSSLTVNATRFHAEMYSVLSDYVCQLKVNDFDSSLWQGARTKLKFIADNC